MKTIAPICAAVLLFGAGLAAQAQTRPVYRCGNGIYQHQPCEGGAVLASSESRSSAQRAEARRVAQLEREAAARKKREKEEAARAAASASAPVAAKKTP